MSETGKEQIAVLFDYVDGEGESGSITWYGYFTEATWQRTIESMRYMGWQGENLGNLDGLETNEVELVLEDESYQGKTRTKVQWVNRVMSLALKNPMDAGAKQAFAARMRSRIAQLGPANGRSQYAPQPGYDRPAQQRAASDRGGFDTPPPVDDDIPF